MIARRRLSTRVVFSLVLLTVQQRVLGFGACDEDSGSCLKFGAEEIYFNNKLRMERPKCKTSGTKQSLKLHWDPPDARSARSNLHCFLFPLRIAEYMGDNNASIADDFNLFDEVLNFTAVLTGSKTMFWKCDVWLTPGIWIPFLGYVLPQRHSGNGIFALVSLPDGQLIAYRNQEGEYLESPATCQVIPRVSARAQRPNHGIITNDTTASFVIEGKEGRATLVFSWGQDCEQEFEVEFLTQPVVSHVSHTVLPAYGISPLDISMKSGRPNVENEIALFLPSHQNVKPAVRLSCLPNITFKGMFTVVSDNDWVSSFNITDLSSAVQGTVCNISLSLNSRDFYPTEKGLTIEGPFVRFLSQKQAVIVDNETHLAVKLDRPLSVPVSVSLSFSQLSDDDRERFVLKEPTLIWNLGEMGIKHFILSDSTKSTKRGNDRVNFVAHLIHAINCEIDPQSDHQKLFTLQRTRLPVFGTSALQVLYPPSSDFLKADIRLLSGSNKLDSVLAYEVCSRQLNEGCRGETTVDFIPEMSGRVNWKWGVDQMTLEIPIHWENVNYCDEVEVVLRLRSIKSASVETAESTIAHVYGTPKGFCGPGMVNSRRNGRDVPFELDAVEDLSLSDMKIEGRDAESGEVYETALVPPFLANRRIYTAMIPHTLRDSKMLLFNKGAPEDVRVTDQSCRIDERLSWKNTAADDSAVLLSEVSLVKNLQQCSLQVEGFDTLEEDADFVGSEAEAPGSDIDDSDFGIADISPLDEAERHTTVFQVGFLQLSDPKVAVLSSVEVRNATHMITLCGSSRLPTQAMAEEVVFKRIEGYPRHPCRIERINYIQETLLGSELFVIPRLLRPDVQSTRIEVSGRFMNEPNSDSHKGSIDLYRDPQEAIMATAFEGVQMENASLSFDVRVTAEDNVTSNLYRFVYGRADSVFDFYTAGSSFDLEHEQNKTDASNNSSVIQHKPESRWCEACAPGTYSIGVDALQCALCRPGHYSDHGGSSHCVKCPEGTYTYTWGSEMCRPCMFGSAANRRGSQFCQLCPDGYMTDREGAAHCTVPVESTDLHRYYAVIASFDVVLNGTSLEEIERLGTSVHAPGLVVLKMLIRTDVAEALNISVGDVAVTKVAPYGQHALSIDVDTTFKVEVPKDAEPEEVHRKLKTTLLHGDQAVSQITNEPEKVFNRTRKATHARPKVERNSAVYRESAPNDRNDRDLLDGSELIAPIVSFCVLVLACSYIICSRFRRSRTRIVQFKPFAWSPLGEHSESSSNDSDSRIPSFSAVRHRPIASRTVLQP